MLFEWSLTGLTLLKPWQRLMRGTWVALFVFLTKVPQKYHFMKIVFVSVVLILERYVEARTFPRQYFKIFGRCNNKSCFICYLNHDNHCGLDYSRLLLVMFERILYGYQYHSWWHDFFLPSWRQMILALKKSKKPLNMPTRFNSF